MLQTSIGGKIKSRERKPHWLDYGEEKYGPKLVHEFKMVERVAIVIFPMTFFWMAYTQEGTAFLIQARRMNGHLGSYTIPPDQMNVTNPLICLPLIPFIEYVLIPFQEKINFMYKPLQRIGAAFVLISISFLYACTLSIFMERYDPVLPSKGNGQIRIYNTVNQTMTIDAPDLSEQPIVLNSLDMYANTDVKIKNSQEISVNYTVGSKSTSTKMALREKKCVGFYFKQNQIISFEDDIERELERGMNKLRTLINSEIEVDYAYQNQKGVNVLKGTSLSHKIHLIHFGHYKLFINGEEVNSFKLRQGGVYTVVVDVGTNVSNCL